MLEEDEGKMMTCKYLFGAGLLSTLLKSEVD